MNNSRQKPDPIEMLSPFAASLSQGDNSIDPAEMLLKIIESFLGGDESVNPLEKIEALAAQYIQEGDPDFEEIVRLLKDFFPGLTEGRYHWLCVTFLSKRAQSFNYFWNRGELLKEFPKFVDNLRKVVSFYEKIPEALRAEIFSNAISRSPDALERLELGSLRASGSAEEDAAKPSALAGHMAMNSLELNLNAYLEAVRASLPSVEDGRPAGKSHVEAWRLISGCIAVCEEEPDAINVPRATNGKGDFHRFLSRTFNLFGVKGSSKVYVDTAYKGWCREVGNSG